MLDIKKIKENPDAVKAGLKAKEVDCDAVVDRILELDVEIRGLNTTSETLYRQEEQAGKGKRQALRYEEGRGKEGGRHRCPGCPD